MVLREKEYRAWLEEQKSLLNSEHHEKGVIKAATKRLKVIQRSLHRNNELLRKG